MLELTKIKLTYHFCDFVKISSCSTIIGGGYIDTHRHMNTQTHIPTCRLKKPRGEISLLGICLHTD